MDKSTIFLLLILTIVGCGKKIEFPINESEFQNKTFSLFTKSEKDTMYIEFQDSTIQIYGDLWRGKIPWRISHDENGNFLILDNKVVEIKKTNQEYYNCTYLGKTDNSFKMVERKSKWNPDFIYGTWINKKYEKQYDYSTNDSVQKPPRPLPIEETEADYQWPPRYKITKDSIKLFSSNSINKSELEINNTSEFLIMDLVNENHSGKEWQWKIERLTNDLMIVEKKISESSLMKYKIDTLIRKKR
jgi:hypothetical protein